MHDQATQSVFAALPWVAVKQVVGSLHKLIVPLKERRFTDIKTANHFPSGFYTEFLAELFADKRSISLYVYSGDSFFWPEEYGAVMFAYSTIYVYDPIFREGNVGVNFDEMRSANQAIDFSGGKKFEINVPVRIVSWSVQMVEILTQFHDFRAGKNA